MNARSTWSRVFDFGTGTGSYLFLSPAAAPGGLRFAITTSGGAGEQVINDTDALSTGVWHHVAVTQNAGVGILYVDGLPVGTNNAMTITPSLLGTTTQNWIGRSQYSPDPYLNGSVDDFRIYNGALRPGEIASLVTPLVAPTGFSGTRGDAQATLNWNASLNANGYNLKRSLTSSGPYALIATNLPALMLTDNELLNGTNYYYVATATNSTGESGNSTQISVRPVSAAAVPLTASFTAGQLQLSWPSDHSGWMLQMQTNASGGGLGTNWITLPGSDLINEYSAPMDPASGSVFYRLLSPY
jgi:hypothetical protein